MASRTRGAESGHSGRINRVIYFRKDGRELAVMSATNREFTEQLMRWAKSNGYEVEER